MKEFKLDIEPKITSGFKAPDAYFDTLESKIMQRIPEIETPLITLFSKRKTWILAAAAVLVIALSISGINYFTAPTSEIDTPTLENYLVNRSEISEEQIAELLNEDDIQHIEVATSADTKDIEEILTTNSNLQEYIN